RSRLAKERPFAGLRIAACLHVTTETANLALALKDGGALVALCASNPLSTQDDAAAAIVQAGISVFARKGEDRDTYYRHINAILETKPQITMDDGADVVTLLHTERKELLAQVKGGTEETTTGVIRLRAMAAEGVLAYPIVAVNEAQPKHMFDNQYGTGQSTVDALLRSTNILLAGKTVVVCGYGWVGRGVAHRFRGMGAIVVISEIDPLRGLEAAMDGYQVMPIADAARVGDIFITATGNVNVLSGKHFPTMKDGAILANSGHFNDEIELPALEKLAKGRREIRRFVEEYALADRKLYVLAEGRLVNHVAAEANPAAVMDMSFANQALAIEYLLKNAGSLAPQVYP
ncbi:MAG: adenosylhomocysteinase, partial [Chloroflexota bacterium]